MISRSESPVFVPAMYVCFSVLGLFLCAFILRKRKFYREDVTFSFSENESQNNLATCGC